MVLTLFTKYFLDFPACGITLDFTFSCIWKHAGQMANSIGVGVCLFFFLFLLIKTTILSVHKCAPLWPSLLFCTSGMTPTPALCFCSILSQKIQHFERKFPCPCCFPQFPLLSVPLDSKTKSCSLAADWWFLLFCNSLPVVDTRVFKFGILPAT